MTEEVQENSPVEETAPPITTETEAPAEAEAAEVAAEPKPEPEPPKKDPWYVQKLNERQAKIELADKRADAAERRAREAEELLKRFNQTAPSEQRHDPIYKPTDDVSREAEIQRAAQQLRFQEDVNDLNTAGLRQFGSDFDQKVNILAHVTGQGEPLFEFVNDIMSVDKANAHAIIHQLGSNPEEAAVLARMNPKQRIAALVRMSMAPTPETKPAAAPARQVSKAPAPAPAIQPTAHKIVDWQSPEADKLSDKEWFAAMNNDEKYNARLGRRR